MLSAGIAAMNLIVVIVLLVFTKAATQSAKAQAIIAVNTLAELKAEKYKEAWKELHRVQGRFQDLNQQFLVLEWQLRDIHFRAEDWKVLPDDWYGIIFTAIEFWPEGCEKMVDLGHKLRELDFNLRCLAMPLSNEAFHKGKQEIADLVSATHPLVREAWEGMMGAAAR
jgi:hypothetical protein